MKLLVIFWGVGFLGLWLLYDALTTKSTWMKRNTFEWPWYYRVHRDERPFAYWTGTIAAGVIGILSFFAPLYYTGQ